jgi:hypothetical protein
MWRIITWFESIVRLLERIIKYERSSDEYKIINLDNAKDEIIGLKTKI